MKINIRNYSNPYLSGYSAVDKDPQMFKERTGASLCDNKNIKRGYNNNVNFSGNPAQSASEVAAKTLGDKILTSKTFSKVLEYAEGHPVSCNALFSLVIAGMLRPATILSLPGEKDKKSKLDAAAHAVASGVIGFIFATIVMSPFDSAMKKLKKDPSKYLGKKAEQYLGDLKQKGLTKTRKFRNVEKLIKMGPDILIGIPRSIITIALIPPILKYVFGIDSSKSKSKKAEKVAQTDTKNNSENLKYSNASLNSTAFSAVKGGVR